MATRIELTSNIWKSLACPNCLDSVRLSNQSITCKGCDEVYNHVEIGQVDLRPRRAKKRTHEFTLATYQTIESDVTIHLLEENPSSEVSYKDFKPPKHITRTLLSYFPKAIADNALMLDLGCGTTIHREVAEHAGFEYIGLDYNNPEAPILGDAHAIPLKDNSVEFVLSIAVLEHIRHPLIMMQEINRVLKPNGSFIGTVAFLEPFHEESYYHYTHLGVHNTLKEGGFIIEQIAPSDQWNGITAQFHMGLFPKLPLWIARALAFPITMLHKVWWKIGSTVFSEATEDMRVAKNTGAFTFIARKPR